MALHEPGFDEIQTLKGAEELPVFLVEVALDLRGETLANALGSLLWSQGFKATLLVGLEELGGPVVRARWRCSGLTGCELLDEGIEAVAQGGVGDTIEFGHVLEIAADLEEAEHKGLILWGKAGQRRQGKVA